MNRIVIQPALFAPLVALLLAATGARAANELYRPTPDPDPFYAQPDPRPDVPPGTILDSREITFTPAPDVPMPWYAAWHLKFVSADAHGTPQTAVATVLKPLRPALAGPRPLLAYQEPYNSLGSTCHPSHFYSGSADHPSHGTFAAAHLTALEAGWAVVVTDHEGPLTAYGDRIGGAHVVLDAIRAATSFAPLGLAGTNTPVGVWGFSGSSASTLWASILQPTYAPELNLVGALSGGTAVHGEAILRRMEDTPRFVGGFTTLIGRSRIYPDFFPAANLNATGIAAAEALRDGCFRETTDGSPAPTGRFEDYTTVADPLSLPGAQAVFAATTLPQPSRLPATDVYLYHGIQDDSIPVEWIDSLVESWCDDGVPVTYLRAPGNHQASAAYGMDGVRFLQSRFDGSAYLPGPATTTCNEPAPASTDGRES